jgi:oxidoreductase
LLRPVQIAIIGGGWIAERVYLPCLKNNPSVRVAAAFDTSANALARLKSAAELPDRLLSLDACLAEQVEGVILCTPPSAHTELVARAIRAGKKVLCEKAVFRSVREIPPLSAGRLAEYLMGSASMRLRDDIALVLQWLRQGKLGKLKQVRLIWHRERGVPASAWRTDPQESPLGVLEDLGPHLLDILAAVAGEQDWRDVRLVDSSLRCVYGDGIHSANWFGNAAPIRYRVPDQASMRLQEELATIEVEVRWANDHPGDWCSIVLEGDRGRAAFEGLLGFSTNRRYDRQVCWLEQPGQPVQRQDLSTSHQLQSEAFTRLVEMFIRFCRGNGRPIASYSEIFKVARWMEAVGAANPQWTQSNRASSGLKATSKRPATGLNQTTRPAIL